MTPMLIHVMLTPEQVQTIMGVLLKQVRFEGRTVSTPDENGQVKIRLPGDLCDAVKVLSAAAKAAGISPHARPDPSNMPEVAA